MLLVFHSVAYSTKMVQYYCVVIWCTMQLSSSDHTSLLSDVPEKCRRFVNFANLKQYDRFYSCQKYDKLYLDSS